MVMPGRSFTAASQYRYGFNGKENDKDISAGGQDYGMRIYDSRLGKFLSVDPYTKSYPFYSPYQFAGNDVIRCIDLDGGEPKARTEDWKSVPFIGITGSIDVYDKTHHQIFEANGYVDSDGKHYIVAEDGQAQNKYFYLVNDGAPSNEISYIIENGRNVLVGGHFESFETQNATQARLGIELADGIAKTVFWTVATVTGIEAGLGVMSARNTKRLFEESDSEVETAKSEDSEILNNPYYRQTKEQRQQSKESYEGLLKEHKEKLQKMREDPIGMTKPDKLEQMTKDNPSKEVLMNRLKRQEKEVIDQIKKHEGELKKLEDIIKKER